ncbi:hypothetical protein RFI_28359 [Reticulomyxa filosa]|uniref:Uncharacterized protein n=1 Tax=Reticulomyxa filosa TaxID=46433 RepID=X6M5V9_RETFI|nr:hypothetical protein RFI_28359 [Reticulomyxa filosa]|eukprot:ETO09026.1 hypothetical protein RFI_28359 [Reticulomyxa filosa]
MIKLCYFVQRIKMKMTSWLYFIKCMFSKINEFFSEHRTRYVNLFGNSEALIQCSYPLLFEFAFLIEFFLLFRIKNECTNELSKEETRGDKRCFQQHQQRRMQEVLKSGPYLDCLFQISKYNYIEKQRQPLEYGTLDNNESQNETNCIKRNTKQINVLTCYIIEEIVQTKLPKYIYLAMLCSFLSCVHSKVVISFGLLLLDNNNGIQSNAPLATANTIGEEHRESALVQL